MFNFIVLIIVIVGSLNWLAIGAFQFDVIAGLFGSQSAFISRFIYTLIGLAGIWFLLLVAIKKGRVNLCKPKEKTTNENKENSETNKNDLEANNEADSNNDERTIEEHSKEENLKKDKINTRKK